MNSTCKKTTISMLLLLGFILSACDNSGDDGHPATNLKSTSAKLTESDFDVEGTPLLSTELMDEINYSEEFKSVEDDSGMTPDQITCMKQKTSGYTFKRESDNSFSLDIPLVDLKACFNAPETGITISKYLYSAYVSNVLMQDQFGNPVDLEGLHFTDVYNYTLIQGLIRGYFDGEFEWNINGEVQDSKFLFLSASNSKDDWNKPCAAVTVFTNCVQRTVSNTQQTYNNESDEQILVSVLTANDLGIEPGGTYYTNGTMDFEINNWSGVMTYGADSSVAPTYVATDGTEEISGIYASPTPIVAKPLNVTNKEVLSLPMPKVFW